MAVAAVGKPSLRFPHSAALRTRTHRILAGIEQDEDATPHAGALSALVLDLTKAGLDYYFLRPLQQAKVGFVARQTAGLGMAGSLRMMSPVIRSILSGASTAQLRVIARHIRGLM
jgi:hypothetical protein